MHPNEPRELSDVVEVLDAGGYRYLPQTDSTQLRAQCPGHDGSKPAAWFRERVADNGNTYVNATCFTEGCSDATIFAALGLVAQGLLASTKELTMPKRSGGSERGNRSGGAGFSYAEWLACQFDGFDMDTMKVEPAESYKFLKYDGTLFSTKTRLQAYDKRTGARVLETQKTFQWKPKRAEWPEPHPPLYNGRVLVENLQMLAEGGWNFPARLADVFACESEKSVKALHALDLAAVSGHTGCNSALQPADLGLLKTYTATTGGAVVIVRDRDTHGHKFADRWAAQLTDVGVRVRVVESATERETDDVFDHLAAGHGVEDLVDVTDEHLSVSA